MDLSSSGYTYRVETITAAPLGYRSLSMVLCQGVLETREGSSYNFIRSLIIGALVVLLPIPKSILFKVLGVRYLVLFASCPLFTALRV